MTEKTKTIVVKGGNFPFSKVVKAGGAIYVSGVVGRDDATQEIPFSAADQARIALTKIQNLLSQANADMDDVVKATIFLTDMRYFADVNTVYRSFFSDDQMPARSCVAVSSLPDPEAKVEIEVIAEASL
ncbi:MAG: RidA family protein [Chloroflexi bacterium]|nr:RidA family protein [Chloroflexota bacterium]